MTTKLHICTFGAERGLCGGVLAPLTDVTIAGRRTRVDTVELLDPSDDTTWTACTLDDVELEMGFLASLPGAGKHAVPCASCMGHLARMRATAKPPVRHLDLGTLIARCGRALASGAITGRTPGVLATPVSCVTCELRASQRDERERQAAVKRARQAERREAKLLAKLRQRADLDAADRAFAWLDEGDDLGVN